MKQSPRNTTLGYPGRSDLPFGTEKVTQVKPCVYVSRNENFYNAPR